ncbi:hypothetical protein D3C76_1300760 [compost metagenome]
MLWTVLRFNLGQGSGVQGRKQFGVIHQHHRRGVFRQKNVGRGCTPFLHQLITQLTVAAITQGHFNAGVFSKTVHPGFHQVFMLGVINNDTFILRCGIGGKRQHHGRRQQGNGAERSETQLHTVILFIERVQRRKANE